MTITEEYLRWNRRLLDYCSESAREGDGTVFLTVEPFLEAQPEKDAEILFTSAVSRVVSNCRGSIWERFSGDDSTYPQCAALLGVTVLAAAEMEDLAYYRHLAELLGLTEERTRESFATDELESAWCLLRKYFRSKNLILPQPPTGYRFVKLPKQHALLRKVDIRRLAHFFYDYNISPRYSNAEAEIEHHFSGWMSRKPLTICGMDAWNDPLRRNSVLRQVIEALSSWDEVSYRGWRSLSDNQRKDTTSTNRDSENNSRAVGDERHFDRINRILVELYLEIDEEKEPPAKLFFRLNSQDNLPKEILFGGGKFIRRGRSYQMISIGHSSILYNIGRGCESEPFVCDGRRSVICFQGTDRPTNIEEINTSAFIFVRDEWGGGFVQTRALQKGMIGAILIPRSHETIARQWILDRWKMVPGKPYLGGSLDDKWVLFTNIKVPSATSAPAGIPQLHINDDLFLKLQGGLRLDSSKHIWMKGATPTPLFIGVPLPKYATVNDINDKHERSVNSEGKIHRVKALLISTGEYHVSGVSESSAPTRCNFIIEEPTLTCREDSNILARLFGDYSKPLPTKIVSIPEISKPSSQGYSESIVTNEPTDIIFEQNKVWWLLGETPGVVRRMVIGEDVRGVCVSGEEVTWAIGFGSGRVTVVHFRNDTRLRVSPPDGRLPTPAVRLWFDVITRASTLACSDFRIAKADSTVVKANSTVVSNIPTLWQEFVQQARWQQVTRGEKASAS